MALYELILYDLSKNVFINTAGTSHSQPNMF
uniref:Uncharacterized protein n=1 Tax=Anguilla anguilla TaxID=7936 RepID=A0A0E9V573_ANGAN